MSRVLGDGLCDLDPKVKVKGQILYFLENASPHDVLEVATLNFNSIFNKNTFCKVLYWARCNVL